MCPNASHIPTRRAGRWTRKDACRGFSLFEVILSLVVLIAIAAIVLPQVTGRADEMAHDEMVRSLEAVLSNAHVDAMSSGEAVSIVATVTERPRAVQIVARPGEPRSLDELGASGPPEREAGDAQGMNAFTLEDAFGGPRDGAGVIVLRLSAGVSLVREVDLSVFAENDEPTGPGADGSFPGSDLPVGEPDDPWAEDAEGSPFADGPAAVQEMNLATFRADGSVGADAFFVLGPGDRASRVSISRWTGRVSSERLRLTTDEPELEEPGDEPPVAPPMRDRAPGGAANANSRGPGVGNGS